MEVSRSSQGIINDLGHESRLITLDNFDVLFRGEYINLENAKGAQKVDLENMLWADVFINLTFLRAESYITQPMAVVMILALFREKLNRV